MHRLRLSLSIQQAMAKQYHDEEVLDAADVAPIEAVNPPRASSLPTPPSLKRRLFGWVFNLADYARRFLLASPDHQLLQVRASLAEMQDQISHQAAEQARQVAEQARQAAEQSMQAAAQLKLLTETLARQEAILRELQADRQARAMAAAVSDGELRKLQSILGPRFDELEIKIRPLIEFDSESYAARLADGYVMLPRSEPVFTTMVVNAPSGGLEAGTRRVLRALIKPGMIVADVGANVGLLTVACARATAHTGKVHAFEPDPTVRRQLEKTLHLNGLSWVDVHAAAAGRANETMRFNVSPIIGHSSLYELPSDEGAGSQKIDVQVVRLDDAISQTGQLNVVKIDVEGAELDVLAGMSGHIDANPAMAIIAEFGPSHLERLGVSPETWWSAFAAYGFRAFAISEPTGVCSPITLDRALMQDSINLVFLREDSGLVGQLPVA